MESRIGQSGERESLDIHSDLRKMEAVSGQQNGANFQKLGRSICEIKILILQGSDSWLAPKEL